MRQLHASAATVAHQQGKDAPGFWRIVMLACSINLVAAPA